MVQVPADTSVSVVPDTVQTGSVFEVKVTVRPDEAVAFNLSYAQAEVRARRVMR